MSLSFSSRHVWLGAAAVAFSGSLVCSAQTGGAERGWPIEFSSPKGEAGTTNMNQLMRKLEGLKQFEEDAYQPLQSLAPQSSLDAVAVRPTRPPAGPLIQNKRVKELLERRKNWVFMNPQDLVTAPTIEDILKTPALGNETQDQKEGPPLQRYYGLLPNKRPMANDPSQPKSDDWFGPATQANPREDSSRSNGG